VGSKTTYHVFWQTFSICLCRTLRSPSGLSRALQTYSIGGGVDRSSAPRVENQTPIILASVCKSPIELLSLCLFFEFPKLFCEVGANLAKNMAKAKWDPHKRSVLGPVTTLRRTLCANFRDFIFQRLSEKGVGRRLRSTACKAEDTPPTIPTENESFWSLTCRLQKARSSEAAQPPRAPRRCLLCAQERLPVANVAEGLPALEDRVPLLQEMEDRSNLGENEPGVAAKAEGEARPRARTERARRGCLIG